MTWTRERPKGVDAVRNYRYAHHPNGARTQIYYREGEIDHPDSKYHAVDSWWHPVRADGRYPALPVEDGRKWVPTKDGTITTGMVWNAYGETPPRFAYKMIADMAIKSAESCNYKYDYVIPYRDGDGDDYNFATMPPLPTTPSDETPAPLTPAEEATLRAPQAFADGVRETMAEYQAAPPIKTPTSADLALHLTAPEPSRLEIAARIMAGFAAKDIELTIDGETPEAISSEIRRWADEMALASVLWTDALIAAARKGGGA